MPTTSPPYTQWLRELQDLKRDQVRQKRALKGPIDADEQGIVPLPEEASEVVEAVSGSGVVVKDQVLKGYEPESNHPSGGFFGPRACGENFRRLLEAHPTYVKPFNSMAGVYMVNFISYRSPGWNPDLDYSHLHADHEFYGILPGIGGVQHFCPDLTIGLELGWGGLLDKVRHYARINPDAEDFYHGLGSVVTGAQGWIQRHADTAESMAEAEPDPDRRDNLETIAATCRRLVTEPPATFREACQWLVFFQAIAKMYNGSGEWGQLDEMLRPYYEADVAEGRLDDEEAVFHLACLLLSETAYIQLGGPEPGGGERTSKLSYLILEAVHRLKTPANIGVRVGEKTPEDLLRRSVEILFEDRMGFPKFVADEPLVEGFVRAGWPRELAEARVYSGCHWLAVPGREYGLADMVKIDLALTFRNVLQEMMEDASVEPSVAELWQRYRRHLGRAIATTAEGIDFQIEHMHEVFPELVLDLFCHGPVERGIDASHGGVEIMNIAVDGSSLATVADSFAALEQRIEHEGLVTWQEMWDLLESNWAGPEGERIRRLMRGIPRFGSGDSLADEWAKRVSGAFTDKVIESPTPDGHKMVPGLFTWALAVPFGERLGATPNGRRAGEPVSHGPNPEPGFNAGQPGTPTQMAVAVAAVQPGYGNTAPLQLDMDPGVATGPAGVAKVAALLRGHFALGGTMININIVDRDTILAAADDPAAYPDLIVRITGFSAYFASLSPELRQYVVDRVVAGA
jgi:formate C-acetyltransferase